MAGFPGHDAGTHYGDTMIVDDVTQMVFDITPDDTPFIQLCGEGRRAVSNFVEWPIREITTRAHNAAPEGFAYNFSHGNVLPTRTGNIEQILSKEIRVSNSEQAYDHHAINELYADQVEVRLREIATDYEHAQIVGTLATGNATNVEPQMRGIIEAITTNASSAYDGGGTVSLSETVFNNRLQVSYELGGAPRDVLTAGAGKRNISQFTSGVQKFIAADRQTQVNTISVYESDFFTQMIRLSRDIPANNTAFDVVMLDRTMLKRRTARPFISKRTADIADSTDGVIVGESSLEWGEPGAHHYLQDNSLN